MIDKHGILTRYFLMGKKQYTKNRKMPHTIKIIGRLTFSPKKHKQKTRRKLRQQLQE